MRREKGWSGFGGRGGQENRNGKKAGPWDTFLGDAYSAFS